MKHQKTVTVNGKKYTAKQVQASEIAASAGDHWSNLGGTQVMWQYHTDYPQGYFSGRYQPVTTKDKATFIVVIAENKRRALALW